jgi:hypothetical protein
VPHPTAHAREGIIGRPLEPNAEVFRAACGEASFRALSDIPRPAAQTGERGRRGYAPARDLSPERIAL